MGDNVTPPLWQHKDVERLIKNSGIDKLGGSTSGLYDFNYEYNGRNILIQAVNKAAADEKFEKIKSRVKPKGKLGIWKRN